MRRFGIEPAVMLPLIASAYIAFVAGLFAGLAGVAWIAVVAATLIGIGAVLKRSSTVVALALLLGAGAVIAVTSPPAQRAPKSTPHHSGILETLRARAGKAIDRDFGRDAPLARALLIADQSELDLGIRDRYAAAGLVHMLSISGLHVAVIAAAMELVFQIVGAGRRSALIGSVILTGVYVLIIGAPPPAVRSALMLSAGAFSKILQRPSSQWAALAVGAFVPLVNPRTVLDVGYQLSVVGICALFAAGKLNRRFTAKKLRGVKRKIASDLVTSSVACIATAPLVAWTFGRLSLIGPVSNLFAGPVIALVQPMLFARFCSRRFLSRRSSWLAQRIRSSRFSMRSPAGARQFHSHRSQSRRRKWRPYSPASRSLAESSPCRAGIRRGPHC